MDKQQKKFVILFALLALLAYLMGFFLGLTIGCNVVKTIFNDVHADDYSVKDVSGSVTFTTSFDYSYSYRINSGDWSTASGTVSLADYSYPLSIFFRFDSVGEYIGIDNINLEFGSSSTVCHYDSLTGLYSYTLTSASIFTVTPSSVAAGRFFPADSDDYSYEFRIVSQFGNPGTDWISSEVGSFTENGYKWWYSKNATASEGTVSMIQIRNISVVSSYVMTGLSFSQSGWSYTLDDGIYDLYPSHSCVGSSCTFSIICERKSLIAFPYVSFTVIDGFTGLPDVSSQSVNTNIPIRISSFPWSPSDLEGDILAFYNSLVDYYNIPYWRWEDGSICRIPITEASSVGHTSCAPYISSQKLYPYVCEASGNTALGYSNARAYIVFQNIAEGNYPVQPSDYPVLQIVKSPFSYSSAANTYLALQKAPAYNGSDSSLSAEKYDWAYIDVYLDGVLYYSEVSVSLKKLYVRDVAFFSLNSIISNLKTLCNSDSEFKSLFAFLQYVQYSFVDSSDSNVPTFHVELHFGSGDIWNPGFDDAFVLFGSIFRGIISALNVYIAPGITLLSILSVVLAIGILFFVFRIAGLF